MKRLGKKIVDLTSMSLETANALFSYANLAAILGGIFVVLGTAGIFFFGSIREHHGDLEQAALRARTEEARRDAATANERAAESNRDAEQLKLELERERMERLELERRMAPRRVSQAMRDRIRELVPPDKDTRLFLKVAMNNAEGDRLINEIGSACLEAGWPRERIGGSTVAGAAFPEGVTVCVNPEEATGSHLKASAVGLAQVLMEAGLASADPLLQDSDTPVGTVSVVAGLKPDDPVAMHQLVRSR